MTIKLFHYELLPFENGSMMAEATNRHGRSSPLTLNEFSTHASLSCYEIVPFFLFHISLDLWAFIS
jgi:hypothetical protein